MTPRKTPFICRRCGSSEAPPTKGHYCVACDAISERLIVRRFQAGESAVTIAESIGVSRGRVEYVLRMRGIYRRDHLLRGSEAPAEPALLDVPPARVETAQDAPERAEPPPVTPIQGHAYTELLGCEGRITYAADERGDVWRLESGRKREWFGRVSNWSSSCAARRIASPRTLPSDWDRPEVKRRVEGERVS